MTYRVIFTPEAVQQLMDLDDYLADVGVPTPPLRLPLDMGVGKTHEPRRTPTRVRDIP